MARVGRDPAHALLREHRLDAALRHRRRGAAPLRGRHGVPPGAPAVARGGARMDRRAQRRRDEVRSLREAEPAGALEPGLEGLARRRLVPRRPQRGAADRARRGAGVLRRRVRPRRAASSGTWASEVLARVYEERAASMRELVNRAFWMPEANRYAYAIDGRERVLPTVVSNIGHLLWSRVAPQDRATATAYTLLGVLELQRVRHPHPRGRSARLQPAQLPQRYGLAARQRAHRRAASRATAFITRR